MLPYIQIFICNKSKECSSNVMCYHSPDLKYGELRERKRWAEFLEFNGQNELKDGSYGPAISLRSYNEIRIVSRNKQISLVGRCLLTNVSALLPFSTFSLYLWAYGIQLTYDLESETWIDIHCPGEFCQ